MKQKIKKQILKIRDSGKTNMLDIDTVQRLAHEQNMYELVNFIEEDREAYVHFIFYGDKNKEQQHE